MSLSDLCCVQLVITFCYHSITILN